MGLLYCDLSGCREETNDKTARMAGALVEILQKAIEYNRVFMRAILPAGQTVYRGADKSLARPTSRCILFDD